MKSSTFSRSLELAKLAAKLGLKELGSGDLKSRIEQARLIANSLSNLKGAAMKAGQLLSLDLNHYFPPEAIDILSQLQSAAVASPYARIEEILFEELGGDKSKTIKNISTTPIGVASIGQVHRAQYLESEIILKIQYSEIKDSIESDLKILKTIATSFCTLTGRKMNLDPLFKEFRNILEQEINYRKEAELQSRYQKLVSKMTFREGISVRVPKVIEELSTDRVIAMDYEPGMTLGKWMNAQQSQNQRELLAFTMLDLYFHEFFKWGLVQTDPNWANFLVHERSGELALIVLDFGATRTYDREFISNYIKILRLAEEGNSASLRSHAIQFGLIDPRESEAAFRALEEMIRTAIRPFFPHINKAAKFDFSDFNHSLNSQKSAKALADELVYSPPPYNIVFLHRKLAGIYSVLKKLGVSLDISSYWQQMDDFAKLGIETESSND